MACSSSGVSSHQTHSRSSTSSFGSLGGGQRRPPETKRTLVAERPWKFGAGWKPALLVGVARSLTAGRSSPSGSGHTVPVAAQWAPAPVTPAPAFAGFGAAPAVRPSPRWRAPSRECDQGRSVLPMRYLSHSLATARPSLIAHTTRLWPRRQSPAAKTPFSAVVNLP